MKELSIEEKAKRYDEAFRIAQELYNDPNSSNVGKGYVCTVFPKLKENEDEKIRKAIYIYLDWLDGGRKDYAPKGEYSIRDMLTWLEKQGEQKPAWSEEDEMNLRRLMLYLSCREKITSEVKSKYMDWLKSLKERYTWKPSDEQMTALRRMKAAIAGEGEIYKPLNSLYEDLKKLREE